MWYVLIAFYAIVAVVAIVVICCICSWVNSKYPDNPRDGNYALPDRDYSANAWENADTAGAEKALRPVRQAGDYSDRELKQAKNMGRWQGAFGCLGILILLDIIFALIGWGMISSIFQGLF